jgi:hypothetical protein
MLRGTRAPPSRSSLPYGQAPGRRGLDSPPVSLVDKVADGVYRLGSHWVVGISATSTARSLSSIAASPAVRAASRRTLRAGPVARRRGGRVLTHYHSDHVGSAEPIRSESGATVFAPARDAAGVPSGKVPIPGGLASSLWRPTMMRYMAHAVRNGGAKVSPVGEVRTYGDGDVLEVPGGLRAIHTPGHTGGHYSLLVDGAGVLFAGDALGTVNVRFRGK